MLMRARAYAGTTHQEPYDFFSRHFSPWIGIPEDPVTGSAHSYISTYWAGVLNKREFLGTPMTQTGSRPVPSARGRF